MRRNSVPGRPTVRIRFEPSRRDATPLAAAVALVGDRWTLLVVEALLAGPQRFNDLSERIAGIAPNILSARLKHLEREGLMLARAYSRRPPRSVYELTASGRELAGALRLLTQWGARHTGSAEGPRHDTCGTPLEARWYCPTCVRTVSDPGEEELRFL